MACTIIVVLSLENSVHVAHVGDGAVVAKTTQGLSIISEPEECRYVNEVVPLTSKNWENSLRITSSITNVECIAAFTDGCQRASLIKAQDGLQPYELFFNPLFFYAQEIESLKQGESEIKNFLLSQKVSETSEDDKTLLILVLRRRK